MVDCQVSVVCTATKNEFSWLVLLLSAICYVCPGVHAMTKSGFLFIQLF